MEWQEAEELRDSDDESDDEMMTSSSSRKVTTVNKDMLLCLLNCCIADTQVGNDGERPLEGSRETGEAGSD